MYGKILILTVLINNINTENNEICKNCVAKCCPINQYVLGGDCELKTSNVPDFSTIGIYDYTLNRTGNLNDHYTIVTKPIFKDPEAMSTIGLIIEGELILELDDDYLTVSKDDFCVDFFSETGNTTTQIYFWFVTGDTPPVQWDRLWMNLKLGALLVTCFFLLLVILAYLFVKKLRDLKGKIRMAFVTNLFGLYISLGCVQILFRNGLNSQVTDDTCHLVATICYFFYWASCCWMNVSTYNILVSITGFRAVAFNERHYWDKDRRIFLKYCAYSFVIPFVLAFIFVMFYFLRDTSEIINFIMSNGECSILKTKQTNFLYYFHITMLLLNFITLVLYVRIARYLSIRTRQSRHQLKHVNRKDMGIIMHIKIWTLTGMTWILDAISVYFMTDSKMWDVFEMISLASGIGLFIIIICNKPTLHHIYERFQKVQR